MTDPLVQVIVPYARFLECQDRRRRIAAELTRRDRPPAIRPEVVPPPAERTTALPLTGAEIS